MKLFDGFAENFRNKISIINVMHFKKRFLFNSAFWFCRDQRTNFHFAKHFPLRKMSLRYFESSLAMLDRRQFSSFLGLGGYTRL